MLFSNFENKSLEKNPQNVNFLKIEIKEENLQKKSLFFFLTFFFGYLFDN